MSALVGYLAPEGFEAELVRELGARVSEQHGRLVLAAGPAEPVAWAANVWLDPRRLAIASIGDGARQLRAIQRNWVLLPHAHHRRAALIAGQLPKVSARPLAFGDPPPAAPLGSWMLLAPDAIIASPRCTSPFPHGEARFLEDRRAPPSRAYLKLWEALTLLGARPGAGERCLDLGASPGGWTWVAASLGAEVTAVDKAPLAPAVARMAGVRYLQASAFSLAPEDFGRLDWLLSDVVCYPERLLRLIERWRAAGTVRRFVCTVKLQGETDFHAIAAVKAIPGSRLLHLHHNKHELTWLHEAPPT
jgi:23S rRNA (cytidine2498-2'-O)-methyltransferase